MQNFCKYSSSQRFPLDETMSIVNIKSFREYWKTIIKTGKVQLNHVMKNC